MMTRAICLPSLRSYDASDIFSRYGGTALGLVFAKELSEEFEEIETPPYLVLELGLLDHPTSQRSLREFVVSHAGSEVVCRLSGHSEAFSAFVQRGANSSGHHSRVRLTPSLTVEDILGAVSHGNLAPSKAIVLQKAVSVKSPIGFLRAHISSDEVLFETVHEDHRYVVVSTSPGAVEHEESTRSDRSTEALRQAVDVDCFLGLLWRIGLRAGFPVNIEGFYSGSRLIAVQVRPIPHDVRINREFTSRLSELEREAPGRATRTYFVFGAYEVEGGVTPPDDVDWFNPQPLIIPKEKDFIPWHHPGAIARVSSGLETLFLDLEDGFHLAHDSIHLPEPGLFRERYRYFGAPWMASESLSRSRVRLLSDGHLGILILKD